MTLSDFLVLTDEEKQVVKDSLIDSGFANEEDEGLDNFVEFIGPISKLFTLNDENFKTVAPFVEEGYRKSLNSPEYKRTLQQLVSDPNFDKEQQLNLFNNVFIKLSGALEETGIDLTPEKAQFISKIIAYYEDAVNNAVFNVDMVTIPIEITSENGRIPRYGSEQAAGADVFSTVEMDLAPGEQTMIPLDIKAEIPEGYAMLIQPRSGQSAKTKLRICNTPGLIDSDYRGVIGVLVENIDPPIKNIDYEFVNGGEIKIKGIEHGSSIHIDKGQRIAQARIVKVPKVNYLQVSEVNETARGEGGLGSTGLF